MLVKVRKSGYLPTLDGWRAIAILAVLLDHLMGYSDFSQRHPRLAGFTRTGPNGVSLFFAISGFLICSRLLEENRAYGSISLRGFYIRRAFRIFPPALLYLIVIALLALVGLIAVSPAELLSSALFFRNYMPLHWISRGWGGYTVHYWSLAVEEHFYLLWPAALVLLGLARARWFALSLSLAVASWRLWDLHQHWFDHLIPGLIFGTRTDVRLDALLLGCVAALLLYDDTVRAAFSRRFKPWMWWLAAASYATSQAYYLLHQSRGYSLLESSLLPLLIVGTVYGPRTFVTTVLETSILKRIGRLSYSLYLWQQLFAIRADGNSFQILQKPPLNIAIIFFCAWLSYRFVERPFIRWGHRLAPPLTEGREDLVPQTG